MGRGVPGRPPVTPNLGEKGLLYIPYSGWDWVSVGRDNHIVHQTMFRKWCKFVFDKELDGDVTRQACSSACPAMHSSWWDSSTS